METIKNLLNNISSEETYRKHDTDVVTNDNFSDKRCDFFGKCSTCNKYNTDYSWCQTCDPYLLTQGWTSGNETIDEIIKSTQLKATKYDNSAHLQCSMDIL